MLQRESPSKPPATIGTYSERNDSITCLALLEGIPLTLSRKAIVLERACGKKEVRPTVDEPDSRGQKVRRAFTGTGTKTRRPWRPRRRSARRRYRGRYAGSEYPARRS